MSKSRIADRIFNAINRRQGKVRIQRQAAADAELQAHLHAHAVVQQQLRDKRYFAAVTYLKGSGIEIGALHRPLVVPAGIEVKYLDRYNVEDLRKHYPELAELPLVEVDIVDDGETMKTVEKESQDFVIANHFIEHCQDPISTIKNMLRVIKPGGIIYMAIPDKRYTFDKKRPLTPFNHVLTDHEKGPEKSKRQHFEEWVSLVKDVPSAEVDTEAQKLIDEDYSIHFHVWDQANMRDFFAQLQQTAQLPIEIEMMIQNNEEVIFILRKTGAPRE